MNKKYSLYDIYPKPTDNGYGEAFARKRFAPLLDIQFSSVLDVGSGPCFLHKWLVDNKIDAEYEAVDIRPETLKNCKCLTYQTIPLYKQYDLVCLFGTVTYNVDYATAINKQILISLLQDALRVSKKYILFTVIKKEGNYPAVFQANRFLYYSHEELVDILNFLGIKNFTITCNEDIDSNEWFVLCKVA
jgi:SAM-dependent methyltransferase